MKLSFTPKNGGNESSFICSTKGTGANSVLSCKKNTPPRESSRSKSKSSSSSSSESNLSADVRLISALPWELIVDNVKTYRYIIMNFQSGLFDPSKLKSIARTIEDFVSQYVFPSWRMKVRIEIFQPPSPQLIRDQLAGGTALTPGIPLPGEFIPIFLVHEFDVNISNDFGTAVHGAVSGSVMNGYSHLIYLNGDDTQNIYPNLPFGTPFIVIPAGSTDTGNGIAAEAAANQSSNHGPSDFYQVLSNTMAHEIIETLIDPTGLLYTIDGNPLGLGLPVGSSTTNLFWLHEACDPVSQGKDNIFSFQHWSMPNFVYPAYFHPFVDVLSNGKAVYDLLGHVKKPFQPYKGTQFALYQEQVGGVVGDLQAAIYTSSIANPNVITLTLNGSIYDYTGWGLLDSGEEIIRHSIPRNHYSTHEGNFIITNKKFLGISVKTRGRRSNQFQFEEQTAHGKPFRREGHNQVQSSSQMVSAFNPLKPQLLPFQFIDTDEFLAVRFVVINYLPTYLVPAQVDLAIPVLNKHLRENYLPYWNKKGVITANYTITSPSVPLPNFDGTFIPLFIVPNDFWNLASFGALPAGSGAFNTCNTLNPSSGPRITDYWIPFGGFTVPNLKPGNPYLMLPRANISGAITITTDQPGLGPFVGVPNGSAQQYESILPFTAGAVVASPDINACTPLPAGSMTGKIGINIRSGCDSGVYPNIMADAGAIATITLYPGGGGFSAPGALVYGVGIDTPDGQQIIDALALNPNLQITFGTVHPSPSDIQSFSGIISHEMEELTTDPSYGDYIATSNPPVDGAILFNQVEASDMVEAFTTLVASDNGKVLNTMNCFPLPSYFIANMRAVSYDNLSLGYRALIPQSRQQSIYQVRDEPAQISDTVGIFESTVSDLDVDTYGSIFDLHTFAPPYNPVSFQTPIQEDASLSALASIYDTLQNLNNVFFI